MGELANESEDFVSRPYRVTSFAAAASRCHFEAKDFSSALGTRYQETRALRTNPPAGLREGLLSHFTAFQLRAKSTHEHVEATRAPVVPWLHQVPARLRDKFGSAFQRRGVLQDVFKAEQMLLDYAESLAREIAAGRDEQLSLIRAVVILANMSSVFFSNALLSLSDYAERCESFRPKTCETVCAEASGSSSETVSPRKLHLKIGHAAGILCLTLNVRNMCPKKEKHNVDDDAGESYKPVT